MKMKGICKKLHIVIMLIACLMTFAEPSYAASGFDPTAKGTITMTLRTKAGDVPVEGAEFSVYHVALCELRDDKLYYYKTSEFEGAGFDLSKIDKRDTAHEAADYVKTKGISGKKGVIDSDGRMTISDLSLGLYLVVETKDVSGFTHAEPFFITVGRIVDGKAEYISDCTPKVEVKRITTPTPTPGITPTPGVTPTPGITPTPKVTPTPGITPQVLAQTGQNNGIIPLLTCIGMALILTGLMLKLKEK